METPLIEPDEVPEREVRITARLSAQSLLTPEELQRTIGEVKTAAEEEQARLSHPLSPTVEWYRRPVVAGLLVGLGVIIWAVQLVVLKPQVRELQPLERADALRYQVMLQAVSIEDFRDRTGQLPGSLLQTDKQFPGVTYQRVDSLRYRLSIRDSSIVLTWQSDSSLSAFLGGSVMRMRETKLK